MPPEMAQQPFAELQRPAEGGGSRRPLWIAGFSAWLPYLAIYAILFDLSGASLPDALRGALANGIPDGLLALAVVRMARKLDAARAPAPRLVAGHVVHGLVALVLAG